MDQSTDKKGAAVKIPPPLIVTIVIASGYGLDYVMPLPVSQATELNLAGYAIIGIALSVILAAAWSFFQFKTHIEPWKPTSAIIKIGLFGYSRNPIYLGFCIATIGIGLVLNSWWIIVSVAPLIYLLYFLVIRLEEAYLLRKFGDDYREYQRRVRRWL